MEACKYENGSLCRAIGSQWSDHQLISLIDELLIEIVDFPCMFFFLRVYDQIS
jgi:hypothetical protein